MRASFPSPLYLFEKGIEKVLFLHGPYDFSLSEEDTDALPPAMPKSASRASPGPFTTHPITATVTGFLMSFRRFSTFEANPLISISHLPHVGQEMR